MACEPDGPGSSGHGIETWPPTSVERLGRKLYQEWTLADPSPEDVEWTDLSERGREMYCHLAEAVVTTYLAMEGRPTACLR